MPDIHIDNNVYILGAGFSRPAGMPLVWDFLNKMRDCGEWLSYNNRVPELEAIEEVFNFRLGAAGAAYRTQVNVENIEELFSLASAEDDDRLSRIIPHAIAATLDFSKAQESISNVTVPMTGKVYDGWKQSFPYVDPRDGTKTIFGEMPFYDFAASVLSGKFADRRTTSKDTVVTFNYDTILDDAFRKLDILYDYGLSDETAEYWQMAPPNYNQQSDVQLLKLHGSVNWGTPRKENRKIRIYESYERIRGNNYTPLLLPPTWRKVFGGGLTEIWQKAVSAISNATRLCLIGFSIPTTDIHFKYLLSAGLKQNISLRQIDVIDINTESVKKNLSHIVRQELIDNGTIQFFNCNTEGFFNSGPLLRRIGRYSNQLPFAGSVHDSILYHSKNDPISL